jgi:hypothetical protein
MLELEFVYLYPEAAIIKIILHKVERSLALKDQRGSKRTSFRGIEILQHTLRMYISSGGILY